VLSVRHVSKHYPGVRALSDVSLELLAGEVHMLLGENGAGKSTLVKILSGAIAPDAGARIELGGQPVQLASPEQARKLGIAVIHQELRLLPNLNAVQNMWLGRELRGRFGQLARARMRERARATLERFGLAIDLDAPVAELSIAQQQLVEIAAALLEQCRVLILDEPTSALSSQEVERLGAILERLAARGVALLYITHRFEEVFAFGHRYSVLRDGELVQSAPLARTTRAELIRMMIGRDVREVFPPRSTSPGEIVLEVRGLTSALLRDVSFSVHAGEIVGLAGLMGAGRTEVARALFGADTALRGEVRLRGRALRLGSVRRAVALGLGLVPEDRKAQGLVLGQSVFHNVTLAALEQKRARFAWLSRRRQDRDVRELSRKLRIKAHSLEQRVATLSGGNQQKVVLAKWLHAGAQLFFFDEPTRGIDVAAKQEIYELMNELAGSGAAIVMISSELPEVLGMADRILVMCEGRISGQLARAEASPERILELATRFTRTMEQVSP
jgi:ABC-type sugar transport system ATPase subunit